MTTKIFYKIWIVVAIKRVADGQVNIRLTIRTYDARRPKFLQGTKQINFLFYHFFFVFINL